MKALLLFLAAVIPAFGQGQVLSPDAEFDLNPGLKPHHFGKYARSYFAATPNGLTLVIIGENGVSLTSADLDGRILHSRSDLASVHAQIQAALTRPDGSVWLVSSGPYNFSQSFGTVTDGGSALPTSPSTGGRSSAPITYYNQLDLYNPAGDHLGSLRLLAEVAGSESPIAADNDQLALRNTSPPGFTPPQTLIHFGTVAGGQFKERTQVRLSPPVAGGIPLFASNGDLLLIDRASGNMVVIDPRTKGGSVVRLAQPHLVRAAATASDYVYLLSGDSVLKTDLAGHVLYTCRFQFRRRGFAPAALAVTGNSLYVVDKAGHTERFQLN